MASKVALAIKADAERKELIQRLVAIEQELAELSALIREGAVATAPKRRSSSRSTKEAD